jgi:uncharacterized protein YndB with AHSA1/START domain
MTSPDETEPLVREVRIAARPETIFAFFTDPEKMVRWKGISAELDPRPGGVYRVVINARAVARGRYVEIVPYTRIVFTWGWEGDDSPLPPGASTVEISLMRDGDATLVRLRHLGLPPDQREAHAQGWDHYLPRLVSIGESRDPGPDPLASAEMHPGIS